MPETAWGKFAFQWRNTYTNENRLFGPVGEYNGTPACVCVPTSPRRGEGRLGCYVACVLLGHGLRLHRLELLRVRYTPRNSATRLFDSNGNFLRFENRMARASITMCRRLQDPWNGKVAFAPQPVSARIRRSPALVRAFV